MRKSFTLMTALGVGLGLGACMNSGQPNQSNLENSSWQLVSMNNTEYKGKASLSFGTGGQISGNASCNMFSGTQTALYPAFDVDMLALTRKACIGGMEDEATFVTAIKAVDQANVVDDTLTLRQSSGPAILVFKPSVAE